MDKYELVICLVISTIIGFLFANGYLKGKKASLREYLETALSVAGEGCLLALLGYLILN